MNTNTNDALRERVHLKNKIVAAILSYPPDTMSKAEFMADQILAAFTALPNTIGLMEPTEDMLIAGNAVMDEYANEQIDRRREVRDVFKAMLKAAPAALPASGWRPTDEAQRLFLWALLDEIDTASDIFKDNYEGLAKFVYRKAQERHKIAHSDGYRLVFNDVVPLVQPGDGDLMRLNATPPSEVE